jgi:hypothetical protein
VEWVSTCLKEGRLVPEDPFRLHLEAPSPEAEPEAEKSEGESRHPNPLLSIAANDTQ